MSHAFKRPRLVDGHCTAIGFPLDRVSFLGIDPEAMAMGVKGDALEGVKMAVGDWEEDPFGRGAKLAGKRMVRNPWSVWQGVFRQDTEDYLKSKSGLVTKGTRRDETLQDTAPRPWL